MDKALLKEVANKYPDLVLQPYGKIMLKAGFEGLDAFIDRFGGTSVYIPRHRSIFSACIYAQIKEEFNGFNLRELCRKYDISEKTVKSIISSR